MRWKKIIAPIIISCFLILYFVFFGWIWSIILAPYFIKIMGIIIPLGLISISIYMLIERIKEIRSGEEDDLSKY